nr:uncharacterized protein LOC115117211 [Oncorhynchus nerka]
MALEECKGWRKRKKRRFSNRRKMRGFSRRRKMREEDDEESQENEDDEESQENEDDEVSQENEEDEEIQQEEEDEESQENEEEVCRSPPLLFNFLTPLLYTLHWLPVKVCIHFKTLVFAYGAARGTSLLYLQALLKPYTPTRARRSSTSGLLALPPAAFDTVNHQILLSTLSELGISGAAHAWIASYLTGRSYQVANRISACLADISVWMTDHHLKLNLGKTELLFLPGKDCPFHDLAITVDNSIVSSSQSAKNLGVILDNTLSFSTNIKAVARSCRFMLYNIRRVRPCLTQEAAQVLIQALVISRLDYCNSLLAGLPACAIKPLQLIQNAAARLVFNLPKFSHVTPLLRSLHWLPVEARIRYKTMVLAYGAVRGTAPQYLQALIRPYTQTRALRSSTSGLLASLPLRKYSSRSAQSKLFAALAPQWWNKLPHDARTAESITTFRRHLKPHLFKEYIG